MNHHRETIIVGLAILMSLILPTPLLVSQRFHHDEALYATWAWQVVSGRDMWLAHTAIDKPPGFIYLMAGFMGLLGPTETVARLPSLIATAVSVGLTYALGQKWYDSRTGLVAAWLMALSPFSLLFAPTAFTDPLLVMLILTSCWWASNQQPIYAGLCFGLAMTTKQQAIFFLPLVIGCYGATITPPHQSCRFTQAGRFALGLMTILMALLVWDTARREVPSFLLHSATNYGGLSVDGGNFVERGQGFLKVLSYGTASPALNWLMVAGLPLLMLTDFGLSRGSWPIASRIDSLLIGFSLLYLCGHALLSFQIWDRYLLGLVPLGMLLLARILLLPLYIVPHKVSLAYFYLGLVALLLAVTLARPVSSAINGRYPLGSNSRALQGIEQIVAYLQGHIGADQTLYHHWLGTHWRFYLWNYPYDLQYWASPIELGAKAQPGQLIAFPTWQSETMARLALAEQGLTLQELSRAYDDTGRPSIILYHIMASPHEELTE